MQSVELEEDTVAGSFLCIFFTVPVFIVLNFLGFIFFTLTLLCFRFRSSKIAFDLRFKWSGEQRLGALWLCQMLYLVKLFISRLILPGSSFNMNIIILKSYFLNRLNLALTLLFIIFEDYNILFYRVCRNIWINLLSVLKRFFLNNWQFCVFIFEGQRSQRIIFAVLHVTQQ